MVEDPYLDGVADLLGIEPAMVVQRRGRWKDVDHGVRAAVERRIGGDPLDESADEIVEVVLLCWRAGDGDLVDALMDAMGNLSHHGVIWLLAPEAGRDGQVEPGELAEAVPTAGLLRTSDVSLDGGWAATRLTRPPGWRTRR
ncbi:MAG TPA: DUF3052 domain-containing protein [Nonomuraea sp.]|nr:DUF3052 domain-containing protein [Nonomuraea sp.]